MADPMTRARRAVIEIGVVLLADAATVGVLVNLGGNQPRNIVLLVAATTPLYAAALLLLARSAVTPRRAALLVLAGTALLQLAAITASTTTSNDDQRYVWDAKVQLAGIDPYRYGPLDPHLAGLRGPGQFTPADTCRVPMPGVGCVHINHPFAHTIYPPVAEGFFVVVRVASAGNRGGHFGQLSFQLAAALGVIALTAFLCRRALRQERPMWHAALWGWCPVVAVEYANNAHIDWLAALFTVLALSVSATATSARRSVWSGVLIGAAIATKLYPAVVLPSMLRRRGPLVIASAIGLVAVSYLPHVLAVGTDVLGYLPGYLHDEGYESGGRLQLISTVLPHPLDTVAGAVILLAVVAWALWRTDPDAPERTAVTIFGATLLVTTPNYGWYAAILVALVAMTGRWAWLPVAFAPTLGYVFYPAFQSGFTKPYIWLTAAALSLVLAAAPPVLQVRRTRAARLAGSAARPGTAAYPRR